MDIKDNDILSFAIANGIINIDDVQNKMKEEQRNKILKKHKYAIFQGKDGRWRTTLPDDTKKNGRRLIAKTTKEKVEEEIITYYTLEEDKEIVKDLKAFKEMYIEWIQYKALHTTSDSYPKRIDNDYKKYYKDTDIENRRIADLNFVYLDKWANSLIKDNNLTKKQYYNATIIIRQCLDYCVDLNIIPTNPFTRVKINKKMFAKPIQKPSETQVFLEDEEQRVYDYALFKHKNKPKFITPLAIALNFNLGLRVCELVSIKWSDIDGDYITIQREEVAVYKFVKNEFERNGYKVVDHAKSDAGVRSLYLNSRAKDVLKLIKETNEHYGYYDNGYVFVSYHNRRLTTGSFNDYLYNLCDELDINRKSSHKIRKTYISSLFDAKLNINTIREIAGHEDERTSLHNYCFERKNKTDIEKALESLVE